MDDNEKQFKDDPRGWAQRWEFEMNSSKKELRKWHDSAEKIIKQFLDDRDAQQEGDTRWNLFTANIQTQKAMLYGKTPQVNVTRRFSDAKDSIARVAAELLERLLNTDIEMGRDSFAAALDNSLIDRLLVGLGTVRLRYAAEFQTVEGKEAIIEPETGAVLAEEIPDGDEKSWEDVETDYVHWSDQRWNICNTFQEVRWWAFRNRMTREQLNERFGEEIGKQVPLNAKKASKKSDWESSSSDPWSRAEVWEIWDKEHLKVFWWVEGFPTILDSKDDPYELSGFWPFPKPMFANLTTSKLMPRPDFVLVQDLYLEINEVSSRITLIEKALKVAGLYDKTSADGVGRLLNEARQNQLIPVDNWAAFAEKGGMKGVIDWLPIEQIVAVMDKLRDYRTELISATYQITGMSDIMRGQASETMVTATEQSIKARFASVRMQALQDELARFATDAQAIKAEMIARLFKPETILERSNAQFTYDAQLAMQAVQLLKSDHANYRIEVKPEAISMADFAQLKAERAEFVMSVGSLIQAATPLMQASPASLPFVLEIIKWAAAGLRGASSVEGILDQAITQAEQAAQQAAMQPQGAQPDPKLMANQQKNQADQQKIQLQLQSEIVRAKNETQELAQRDQTASAIKIKEEAAKARIKNGGSAPFGTGGQV